MSVMARCVFFSLLATSLMLGSVARADVTTVKVVQVGGQPGNLFVVLSQTVGTDLPCPGTRLIPPSAAFSDTDSFKRFYAAMLAAQATSAQVTIAVSGCYSTYPSMLPTDFWFSGS
jgi:hypothetical protein